MAFSLQKLGDLVLDFLSPENKEVRRLLELDHLKMRRLLGRPRSIDDQNVHALFDYTNKQARTLIRALKYKANLKLINKIATLLYDEIIELSSDIILFEPESRIIITPMPMNERKRAERGWNQSQLICREIERLCESRFEVLQHLLLKFRDTKRQTDLGREERLSNVKNSMRATEPLNNSTVIVIDDVYTTGATFDEARRALLATGARQVVGLFLAH